MELRTNLRTIALFALAASTFTACEYGVGPGTWNNPLDPDGTNYHPPVSRLADTAIHDGATGFVYARVSSPVSSIVRVDWTLDGVTLPIHDSILSTANWSPGSHSLSLKAVDAQGLAGPTRSVRVWIGNQAPFLQEVPFRRVASSDPASVVLSASDVDGGIASIAWDTVPDRYSIMTNSVNLPAMPDGGIRTIRWRATDNEGASSSAEFQIAFVPPPRISIEADWRTIGNGTSLNGTWNIQSSTGKIDVVVEVDVPGFDDEGLSVEAFVDGSKLSCAPQTYHNPSNVDIGKHYICTESAPAKPLSEGHFLVRQYSASVTDPFGRKSQAEFSVTFHN